MKTAHHLVVIILLAGLPVHMAAQSRTDSLRRALDTARSWPTIRQLHQAIGSSLRKNNPDSTLLHAEFILQQAGTKGDEMGLYMGHNLRAVALQNKGRFVEALQDYQIALDRARIMRDSQKIANEMFNMAYPLYSLNRFGEAAEKLFAALDIFENLRDTKGMASANQEIGLLLSQQGRYDEGIAYIQKGLEIQLTSGANPYYSYSRLGNVYLTAKRPDSALIYQQKALYYAIKAGNKRGTAIEKNNIGESYLLLNRFAEARANLLEGLQHLEGKKEAYLTSFMLTNLTKAENGLGRPAEALQYADRVMALLQNTNYYDILSSIHEQRYLSFKALNDYRGALKEALAWKTAADSVNARKQMAQLADTEARYQTREREATIAQQEFIIARQRNRQQLFLLGGLALLCAAAGIFLYLRNRDRLRKQQAEHALRLQQAESEKLRELDKLKTDFFANVSHELRTPLTLLLGPIDSVLKNPQLSSRDAGLLKLAQQNAGNLLRLIGDILDMSKLESGKLILQEEPVAFYPFLNRLTAQFDSHAHRLGIQLLFEYHAPRNLNILIDSKKFETLYNNLLSNALKFTPPQSGGKVIVALEDRQENLLLTVRDSGRGIPPEDLERVFDRFYQSRQAGAPAEGGTGIGLAICAEYARLFGGGIRAESPAPGEQAGARLPGAVFYLEFPKKEVFGHIADAPAEMPVTPVQETFAPELATPAHANAPTVLIVEDNEGLQQYLQTVFSTGFKTVAAGNGLEALHLLETAPAPDLILSDIMMPLMDGFQLLEKLKSDDRFSAIPVIMLTARADIQDKLHALRIGVDDYLLKPFLEEELLARVQNLLLNARRRQEPEPDDTASAVVTATLYSAENQAWLEALEQHLAASLGNFNLTAETLADNMAMSRAQFFRQIKKLTGLTPAQYLDEARFRQARLLLETGRARSVKALAYEVGFRDEKHFSRSFHERFGKYPSAYLS